jgi:hypothetical protein
MKLGQTASIILCKKAPAWTVRIAVHMRATKATKISDMFQKEIKEYTNIEYKSLGSFRTCQRWIE